MPGKIYIVDLKEERTAHVASKVKGSIIALSKEGVIRFADDVMILHHDIDTLYHLQSVATE